MSTERTRVSLLTVTNRNRDFMKLTIEQARKQSFLEDELQEIEHVIVHNIQADQEDDSWHISTKEYLKKLSDCPGHPNFSVKPLFVKRGEDSNVTLGQLRNTGVNACSGDYVVVWDDDDLYHKDRVKNQVQAIKEASDTAVACTYKTAVVNETDAKALENKRLPRCYRLHPREEGWEMTLCCRKDVLVQEEYRYESKNVGEDTPVLKALQKNNQLKVIPCDADKEEYIYMRQPGNAMAGSKVEENWWELTSFKYDPDKILSVASSLGIFKTHIYRMLLQYGPSAVPEMPQYGRLRVASNRICGEFEDSPVQLRGMSLFWHQWKRRFFCFETIKWLVEDWQVNVIRMPIGVVPEGGYISDSAGALQAVRDVVLAAIVCGIYIVVDFHFHKLDDHVQEKALEFFDAVAQEYGEYPHVIFEIWNEPPGPSEWTNIVTYSKAVLKQIRANSQNLVLIPTTSWSSDAPVEAISQLDPKDDRLGFSMHAYMNSFHHLQTMKARVSHALETMGAVFITEWGTGKFDGTKPVREAWSRDWLHFLNLHQIGHVMWNVCDKEGESHSALKPDSPVAGWKKEYLTANGSFMKQLLSSTFTTKTVQLQTACKQHGQEAGWQLYAVRCEDRDCLSQKSSRALVHALQWQRPDGSARSAPKQEWEMEMTASCFILKVKTPDAWKQPAGWYLAVQSDAARNQSSCRMMVHKDKNKAAVWREKPGSQDGTVHLELVSGSKGHQGWLLAVHRTEREDKRNDHSTWVCLHKPNLDWATDWAVIPRP
ncbi:unnamed protein product [Durusdinium trenchii]|uniref:4-beta-glucanase n=2 Tax=Durusdinium trenchii TaxID=1381693 RepID=A0ABP0HYT9_9DINO